MSNKKKAPFGSWESPVTPEALTERRVILSQLRIDGPDVYWIEDNPRRQGRSVLLRRDAMQQTREVLPLVDGERLLSVSTHVHERGGRAYAVEDGNLVVSDGADNRVYSFRVSDRRRELVPLVPLSDKRYGDFEIDLARGLVYAVLEDIPSGADKRDAKNSLVAIPLDGSGARDEAAIKTIFEGTDFVTSPTLSPDGTKLAFLTWNHPEMAWTESELHVGDLEANGELSSDVVLVDKKDVCAYEPRWTLDGDLIHVDDSTGWANLYRTEGFKTRPDEPADAWQSRLRTRALHPSEKAFSRPHWQLGLHSFDNLDEDHLVCGWAEGPQWKIGSMRLDNGLLEEWDLDWEPVGNIAASPNRVVFLGMSPTESPAIVEVQDAQASVIRPAAETLVEEDQVSVAQRLWWTNRDGTQSYGLFYPPTSRDFEGAEDLPPLLVRTLGVPTSAARSGLNLDLQYWTSRGFAVLVPHPRGTTGNGRAYREELNGKWGRADVADIEDGVKFLVDTNRADPARVGIRGESLGAFTVLSALERTNVFTAGVLLASSADLREYMETVNKFEKHYPQRLLGVDELTDEAIAEVSPLAKLERINTPVLFIHGSADHLSSVEGVEKTVKELEELGKPVAFKVLVGEGHLFGHDHAVEEALRTELAFYGKVWDLPVEDQHCEIANWPQA